MVKKEEILKVYITKEGILRSATSGASYVVFTIKNTLTVHNGL